VREKPELRTTKSSWERVKAEAEQARVRAKEAERARQEIEELKERAAMARWKDKYVPQLQPQPPAEQQPKGHRRKRSQARPVEPLGAPMPGQAMDEVDVLNYGDRGGVLPREPSASSSSLEDLERILTQTGGVATGRQPRRANPEAAGGSRPPRPRRPSSFESCVLAYSSPVGPISGATAERRRRRPRMQSDTLAPPPGLRSGKAQDDAWKRLFDGNKGQGAGNLSQQIDQSLQSIYDMGVAALKAATGRRLDAGALTALSLAAHDDDDDGDDVYGLAIETLSGRQSSLQAASPFATASPAEPGWQVAAAPEPAAASPRSDHQSPTRAVGWGQDLRLKPYQRYEQGFVKDFFDPSSTADKGRFRVHDARDFLVSTDRLYHHLQYSD
jgi:hypothetical protein